jgi:hypothetical protein
MDEKIIVAVHSDIVDSNDSRIAAGVKICREENAPGIEEKRRSGDEIAAGKDELCHWFRYRQEHAGRF